MRPGKRIVERRSGAAWGRVLMRDLQVGDVFRMLEPDGSPASDGGLEESRVIGAPKCIDAEADRWSVQVEGA